MRLTLASVVTILALAATVAIADPTLPQFPVMIPRPTTAATVATVATVADPAPTITTKVAPDYAREYGERYVREVGASAGFMIASKFHTVTVAPSFGWFIADNVQISTIVSLTSIKAGADTSTIATATLEPSYHLRLDAKTFAFAGMGFGYSYVRELGHGLTYTVRVGTQFLLGHSGIFVPSISYDFRTNEQDTQTENLAVIAAERALRLNIGYVSMF